MIFAGKGFNEVSNYVKKLEEVTQVGQAKILANKFHNMRNFSGLNPGATVSRATQPTLFS